jgi:coenzyme F420 biosynthesis associated uncharacterized protein
VIGEGADPIDLLVDWELAVRTAGLLGRSGPSVRPDEAVAAVAALRACTVQAVAPVREVTRLAVADGPPARIVDRPGWARANAVSFRELLAPAVTESFRREWGPLPGRMSARVIGLEAGAVLGLLAGRVLGQYDPFGPHNGRLLIVAPNVVKVERELQVVPPDFRMWVCLHEETHRVQFTAAGWLADHFRTLVRSLVVDLAGGPSQLFDRAMTAARSLPAVLRGESPSGPLDCLRTPEQRDLLARIVAIMSLLEGHADVVMDEAAPLAVPSAALIRERFDRRRGGKGSSDRLLRRLLGLEAKARQYADGARFVRHVRRRVDTDGLNAVWSGPDQLPRPEEIEDPDLWLRRVHG